MQLKDRFDDKWAHPEVVDAGFWTTDYMTDPRDIEAMAPEEVEAIRNGFRKPIGDTLADAFPAWEFSEAWTERGCVEEPEAPAVHMMVAQPRERKPGKKLPCVLAFTGGGLTGGGTAELGVLSTLADTGAANVPFVEVCFEYRTAPAAPYPAAINDCHAAWDWLLDHADELGIDLDRIVLYGDSTGGHLALATAFRLKRYGWDGAPMPRGIVCKVPVIEDAGPEPSFAVSIRDPETDKVVSWDHTCAFRNYRLWLGERFADSSLPPEAVPARATAEDVVGMPPLWVPAEAEFEPARDAVYRVARLWTEAGIFCDLHVWGGANHLLVGEGTELAARVRRVVGGAVRDALAYDFRRPWLAEE